MVRVFYGQAHHCCSAQLEHRSKHHGHLSFYLPVTHIELWSGTAGGYPRWGSKREEANTSHCRNKSGPAGRVVHSTPFVLSHGAAIGPLIASASAHNQACVEKRVPLQVDIWGR